MKKYFTSETEFPAAIKALVNGVGIILMFLATSCIAPKLNESFEQQRKQSDFYQTYFESFNKDTKDLYGQFTTYVAYAKTNTLSTENYNNLRELTSRLQLRALELYILMEKTPESTKTIKAYQKSLNDITPYIEQSHNGKTINTVALKETVFSLTESTASVMLLLAQQANIVEAH